MNPAANLLVQLQDLTLIRLQQRVAGKGAHLQRLDDSINAMVRQLSRTNRVMFEALRKKGDIYIVPISDGGCAACGMKLPISLVQAVKISNDILCCPNCARMLYQPKAVPRRVGAKSRRMAPRKPGIARFSSEALMIPRLQSRDKEGAIAELAEKMEVEGFVDGADKLVEAALDREAILSTAVNHGLAFPHVRAVEGGGLTLALGISTKGVPFDGPGKKPSRIIFFLVIPTAASAFYLKLLAGLSQTFISSEARKSLTSHKTPATLWKALVKTTRSTIK